MKYLQRGEVAPSSRGPGCRAAGRSPSAAGRARSPCTSGSPPAAAAGSGLVTTTTVPPRAVHGSERMPAVCVIGAAARLTGCSSAGTAGDHVVGDRRSGGCGGCSSRPWAGRWCRRWASATMMSSSVDVHVAARRRLIGDPARERAAPSGSSASTQTHSVILGSRGRSAAIARRKYFWKNRTSQSKASSTWWLSSAGLRAPTGIQHMLARHRPSVQVQAVTSLVAQTAPLLSVREPGGSRALAMRQESSPTSLKV